MTATPFDPGRDRDAWAILRGYVYQVDVTLDRWLDLEEGETLELECGEDVDLLGRATAAQGGERERLLEQVKHLESSVTLRSGPVRAFLANSHAHRTENPLLRLRFRFTTTAKPGTERSTTMPGNIPGIVAWEQIRAGTWPGEDLAGALLAIRDLPTSPTHPDDLPESTWAAFQDFVRDASATELEEFVRACEWSIQHVPATDYESELHARLAALGLAPDPATAGSLYDRLLAFVFRLLTQAGLKRLTRQALLQQVGLWRQGVPLSPEDDHRVRELRDIVRVLETRVDVVESAVSELKLMTASSAAMIGTLARRQGIAAEIAYVARAPVLEEPPPVERASGRHRTVTEFLRRRAGASWLALHGVSGIGKSQLALLLARETGDTRVWIRFRDLAVPQACLRYDAALAQLAERPAPAPSRPGKWVAVGDPRAALANLGCGAVVVLDDLPRYHAGDDLSVRLVSLAHAAAEEGVLVLSTSPYPVPSAVLDSFAAGQVLSWPAPPFTIEEVRDVLSAFGAPELWQEQSLAMVVHTVTRGHPTLVRACARYLASHGWVADTITLSRILGADFAAGVNDETVRALIDSIPDSAARELLFRLNLVGGEFGVDEVQLLAGVEPVIPGPRSHLNPLLGLWVQSDAGGRYVVSPLVRPLRGSELAPETHRQCHRVLAEGIISSRVAGDVEVTGALSHFVAAEAFNSAGWVLLRGLVALRSVDLPEGVLPLFSLAWLDNPLPEQMDLGLRLLVRALQLDLCVRSGRDVGYVRADLDRLMADAGDAEQWEVFTALVFAFGALGRVDVASAGGYLLRALRLRPRVLSDLREQGFTAPEMPLEHMAWVLATGVNSPSALAAWMDVLEEMTPEERAMAFEPDDLGRGGSFHVANKLMFAEQEKAPGERNWTGLLESLHTLTDRARALDLHLLADAAVVTRMSIHAEFLRDLPAAEELSEEVLTRPGLDPASAFLVTNTRALHLYDYGTAERAAEWLTRAFALRTPVYGWQSLHAGIYLSIRVAEADPRRAVNILAEATEFAEKYANEVGLTRVEVYGERGVAEWLVGDPQTAFWTWDRAATLLLEAKDDSPAWKSIFVLFAHTTGYFATMARTSRPPAALDGEEPYAAPARGLFIRRPPGRDEAFAEEKMPALAVQLTLFADAVGAWDRALAWARAASLEFRAGGRYEGLILVLPVLVAEALDADDYERALTLAREHGATLAASWLEPTRDAARLIPPPADVLGPEGSNAWLPAECAAMLVLIPIYFRFALLVRRSPEEVRALLQGLTEALRACAARSADPPAWQAAADLFEAIFADNASDPELVARANSYAFRHEYAARVLKVVGYLAASTRPGTSMERSFALQSAVALFVARDVFQQTRAYGETGGAFFTTFWRERFESARFRFSNPREIEHLLDLADAAGPDRAHLALAAVRSGLGLPVSSDLQNWLYQPQPAV